MSSRVLRKDEGAAHQPFPWIQGGAAASTPGSPVKASQPRTEPAGSPSLEEVVAHLRQQLAQETALARERGIAEGRAAGIAEGKAAAERQCREQFEELMLRLARTVEEIRQLRPRLRHEAEEDVVRLALAVARRVLHREITLDPAALRGIIRAALDGIDGRESVRIRVHPHTVEPLRRAQEMVGPAAPWDVVGDPNVAVGALLLETSRGDLDASLETQLAEIERGFADRLRKEAV